MRNWLVILAALLPAASATAQPSAEAPVALAEPACAKDQVRFAQRDRPTALARRLDELPPGNLELAVWRSIGGCRERAIVRTGYGGGREDSRP